MAFSLLLFVPILFHTQNAVMTFEEEKMALALSTLRATEKRCSNDLSWSPSFSNLQQSVRSRSVIAVDK